MIDIVEVDIRVRVRVRVVLVAAGAGEELGNILARGQLEWRGWMDTEGGGIRHL